MNMKKVFLASTFSTMLILSGCGGGGGGGDTTQVVDDLTVTISGQITDSYGLSLPGVTIEGVYNNPGDPLNPSTSSDNNGNFSIEVLKGDVVYLHATKATYATINSGKWAYNANESGFDFGIPTTIEAQDAINLLFASNTPNLADKAWLVVDVISAANGNDVAGQTITAVPAPATTAEAYPDCNGVPGATSTIACTNRLSPMYMAYFDAGTNVSVTVAAETQTAVLRKGEITYLEFEQ